jgi:protein-S-isoprenylcysteine O-methyltransferase Ste14
MKNFSERPNQVPWPPIIYVTAAMTASLMQAFFPLQMSLVQASLIYWQYLGLALIIFGLAFDVSAMVTMAKAQTNIMPNRSAEKLVVTGPFRFTRNPIYVGNTALLIGLGLWFSNPWLIYATLPVVIAVDRLAIRREGAHLSSRFGKTFDSYATKVPRWLF